MRAFEANMLRVASDFFWADYITGFLTETGHFIEAEEWRLQEDRRAKLHAGVVTIPESIITPLMGFMTYTLKGAFHLNAYVGKSSGRMPVNIVMPRGDRKRKRIVVRLSKGLTANKKRQFTLSKLKHSLGDITQETLENQIPILESHAVVSCPTRKSAELTRELSLDVQTYLITHCTFTPPQVVEVIHNSLELLD